MNVVKSFMFFGLFFFTHRYGDRHQHAECWAELMFLNFISTLLQSYETHQMNIDQSLIEDEGDSGQRRKVLMAKKLK